MAKTVIEKIAAKKSARAIFINPPRNTLKEISSPLIDLRKRLTGKFDYIHLFVTSQKEFHKYFPKLQAHLGTQGMLWVSWPKGGLHQTDLNIKIVIRLGYDYGLVESKAVSINETWSALKFTWPKLKVVYNNSYGNLKVKE